MREKTDTVRGGPTCHVSDGLWGALQVLQLGVYADLVLAAWREVIEAVSGSSTPQTHFLPLAV